jgi:hypothetical protein
MSLIVHTEQNAWPQVHRAAPQHHQVYCGCMVIVLCTTPQKISHTGHNQNSYIVLLDGNQEAE